MFRIREHEDKKSRFSDHHRRSKLLWMISENRLLVYDVSVMSKKNEIIIPCKQSHDILSFLFQMESGSLHILCRLQPLS